jgi:hypothetical protein
LGILTFSLVSYQVWRNHLVGPDLRIDVRYKGAGGRAIDGSNIVPELWTYMVSIRNDGSRSGEIRNCAIEVYESEPSDIDLKLHLTHGSIAGIYQKGESHLVPLRIGYMDRAKPNSLLPHKQITKLVAILKWDKEIRKGFNPDIRILSLIPESEISD